MRAAFDRPPGFFRRQLAGPLRRPLGPGWWRHPGRTLERQHVLVEIVGLCLVWELVVSLLNQVPRLPLARHDGFLHGLPGALGLALLWASVLTFESRRRQDDGTWRPSGPGRSDAGEDDLDVAVADLGRDRVAGHAGDEGEEVGGGQVGADRALGDGRIEEAGDRQPGPQLG